MQYSGAQSIVPILKEGILTLDEEPQVKGEEPAQEEPQVDVNEDKAETKGQGESEEQSTFTCMGNSVDKPTKANCTITKAGVSTSFDCNANPITKIWSCAEETAKTGTDESTLQSYTSPRISEKLKGIIQNLR